MGATGFDDLVTASSGPGLVDRPRLAAAVERFVASSQLTLLTGEPGTGKTTLLAALARDHPDWLRYFVHRDAPTSLADADPVGFLLAIGRQLARTRPALFEPDGPSPFDRAAHAGVAADRAYLDPRFLEPAALLELALRAPAARLAAAEPDDLIVILVDATDDPAGEALTDWLLRAPDLPGNVRLVLTTRPVPRLPRLRSARGDLAEVVIPAGTREACDEVMGYALSTLAAAPAQRVAEKAEGNFLYVSAYAHAFTQLTAHRDPPAGLPALYAALLDATLSRDAANREERAVLGLLTVARAPLSAADLVRLSGLPTDVEAMHAVLRRLGPLLRERDGGFALFHESIGEFLAASETHTGWAVDPVEWHRRVVRSCLRDGTDPADVDWSAAGDYELVYLADHLIAAGETARLPTLVCPGLRRAVRARYGHDLWFTRVVDLALAAALDGRLATPLPDVLFLSVVRGELARAAGTRHSPAVLGLAARLGRPDGAWEAAWAMPPSAVRIAALAEVVRYAGGEDRVELLVEQATAIGAVREAAVALARYDLPRALELWHRAGPETPPDPVYRAAGDPAFFARMAAGRTAACLDAAEGSSPGDRSVLLLHAQSGLELLDVRDRVVALARLAGLDRAGTGRYLPALRRDAVLLDVEHNRADARALAEAAALLAGVDETLSVTLLERCARVAPERARALISLGRRDEARLIMTVRLAESPGPEERLRIAEALEPIDPLRATEVADQVAAEVESGSRGPAVLAALVTFLAARDPERAATLARRAPAEDRIGLLAGLAHRHLDEGRTALAESLLGELHVRAAQRNPLRDPESGLPFRTHPAQHTERPAGAHQPYLRDVRIRWADRLRRRLLTDPADVIRAMTPGPSSAGNPYSLARVLRVFAAHLAAASHTKPAGERITDRAAAIELAAAIEDRGEAAIAQAALVAAAIRDHDLDGEAFAWRLLRNLIVRTPRGHWSPGGSELDRGHLAYLRPDYRARFETAIGVLPYQPDLGSALLTDLPALGVVFQLAIGCDASTRYTEQRLAGRRPDPAAAQVHESLRRQPPGALPDPVLGAVVTAVVSANEQTLGGAGLDVDDPVYRLYALATARTRRAGLPGAGPGKAVGAGPLDMERLPAYAEIVRRNAGSPVVAGLADQLLSAAAGRSDEALLILAEAGYGDPHALLADLLPRLPGMSPAEQDDLLPELSVLLFRHDPARALRFLSDAAARSWPTAAAFLESAVTELPRTAELPTTARDLHAAVIRAVDCCTPSDQDRPEVVDGACRRIAAGWNGRPPPAAC
ncbi:AAA family ATPase [Actinoplanes aureus]|uniref:AAA+ ATPase domain-containing protein n=1 Tax=Actinoplanes aureus TaxID=2792083 RepID=A0A931C4G0_9ACTN|nr:AAA family ATPase [Actinoplanes aureus]MBG0561212.1 hypothetical protein [Actinoplanes aureus]